MGSPKCQEALCPICSLTAAQDCILEWLGWLVLFKMKQKLEISSVYWFEALNKCWTLLSTSFRFFWETHLQNGECVLKCAVSLLTSTLGYIHLQSTNQQNILMLFSHSSPGKDFSQIVSECQEAFPGTGLYLEAKPGTGLRRTDYVPPIANQFLLFSLRLIFTLAQILKMNEVIFG